MSENYSDILNEAKESLSEALTYLFETVKSLDKRIEVLEVKLSAIVLE